MWRLQLCAVLFWERKPGLTSSAAQVHLATIYICRGILGGQLMPQDSLVLRCVLARDTKLGLVSGNLFMPWESI